MEDVREVFLEHVTSLRGKLPWPARSPDLSACVYFFGSTVKLKCASLHYTKPRSIDDLRTAIRKQISAIPENMARRAMGNLRATLEDGQHFSDVLFKMK
jgi:hypothetical protein